MIRRFGVTVQRALDEKEAKKHTDGRTIYRAIATTPALDRYGEVVLPKGALLENFLNNPVLLDSHDYSSSSIGRVVSVDVADDKMEFGFVFSTSERGQTREKEFVDGDMNAFSIGFRPKAVVDLWEFWDDEPEVKEITVSYPDGSEGKIDLRQYEHVPYRVYNQWELLEISTVSVPANPEALLLRQADEIIRRTMEANPVLRSFAKEAMRERVAPLMDMLSRFTGIELDDEGALKIDGVVALHSTPTEDVEWSKAVAKTSLARWASKDGTGQKDDMNWAKYSKGFAWFNRELVDNFTSYTLAHHIVKDDALIAVWKGVTEAMSKLLSTRSGINPEDVDSVYRHLAKHYEDFGKAAPEMKEYSDEELKAIEDEPLVVAKEGDPVSAVGKADDPDGDGAAAEPADGDEDNSPANTGILLQTVVDLTKQVLQAIQTLTEKQDESSETQTESFVEISLSLRRLEDSVDVLRSAQPNPPKGAGQPEVVGEVSEDLVAALEKVRAL